MPEIRQRLGALDAQILVECTLHDAEQRLILARMHVDAALGPAVRAVHRRLGAVVVAGIGRAFVKGHGDIRAQRLLNLHVVFRGDEALAAVQMRTELHALLLDLAHLGERKHLKSAAVGQNRLVPVHELMQSAQLPNDFMAGSQEQVIGVRQ